MGLSPDFSSMVTLCRAAMLVCLFLGSSLFLPGQDSLRISLLSCSPGAELYSIFGHSAIRVTDEASGTDRVYNYGTFNFREKNFYLKFLSGKLNYYLSVQSFPSFMSDYLEENRTVYEQVLNISHFYKLQLHTALRLNALPENRAYKYDFFWDNCSTRIRDKIESSYADSLIYLPTPGVTFRDYLHQYLVHNPWSAFGIDLILGLPADKGTGPREAMFLPLEMMKVFETARVDGQAVCSPAEIILPAQPLSESKSWFQPTWTFLLLLAVTAMAFLWFPSTGASKFIANLLFISAGLAGLLIGFLWFIADHTTTDYNYHFLWANPLCLLYPWRRRLLSEKTNFTISLLYVLILLLLIPGTLFLPQSLPVPCIFIWLALLLVLLPELKGRGRLRPDLISHQ
ncbi:MAG TPA: DUF4105 domain-containing protein [Saprospiraceae bacterium]|nr:DUF4105 domain-containing protein [Saprospiraceae bacterium]